MVKLEKVLPVDASARKWLLPIRAGVAMERQDPKRAIEILKAATPMELGDLLIPEYMRGQACLMLHDGKGAAAEFQKFIDQWGKVGNFPLGALARFGLARAYSLQAGVPVAAVSDHGCPNYRGGGGGEVAGRGFRRLGMAISKAGWGGFRYDAVQI